MKKQPKENKSRSRIDMSAMEPAADLRRAMFKKADRKLAEKMEAEKQEDMNKGLSK